MEMLEVTENGEDRELRSLWELKTGKLYEPVATTRSGLWRYRTRDAVRVVGFSPLDGSPVIEYKERRDQSMRVAHALVSQAEILSSVAGVPEFSGAEFTT